MRKIIVLLMMLFLFLISAQVTGFTMGFNDSSEKSYDIDGYYEYIGANIEKVIQGYGEPTFKNELYGGQLYYYEELSLGFGVDKDEVTSLLLYKGQINEQITIGMSFEKLSERLHLKDKDIISSDTYGQVVLVEYDELDYYLVFYNDLLEEILIKPKQS